MTLTALDWAMLAKQRKLGFIMIKVFNFPRVFSVAILALLTFGAFVHIIALVTREASSGW
jgi:hypothetical protein